VAGMQEDRSDLDTPEKLSIGSSKDSEKIKVDSLNLTRQDRSKFKARTNVEMPFLKLIDPDNESVGHDRAGFLKMIGSTPNPNV
jgi:hypothetical protein